MGGGGRRAVAEVPSEAEVHPDLREALVAHGVRALVREAPGGGGAAPLEEVPQDAEVEDGVPQELERLVGRERLGAAAGGEGGVGEGRVEEREAAGAALRRRGERWGVGREAQQRTTAASGGAKAGDGQIGYMLRGGAAAAARASAGRAPEKI